MSRPFSCRPPFGHLSCVLVGVLVGAFLLFGTAGASADMRFASPAGAAAASTPCLQAAPCSLFNAAHRGVPGTALKEDDEIVVEPGDYVLGPQEGISLPGLGSVHGAAGQPLPKITYQGTNGAGAFFMNRGGETLSRLEIIATAAGGRAFVVNGGGTVEGVIARASQATSPCIVGSGMLRNSVCLATGNNGLALEIPFASLVAGGTADVKLRNVTAIATGDNSVGLKARGEGGVQLNVDALGVIAQGTKEDVLAEALSIAGAGAKVTVALSHSDFAQIKTENDPGGATATITSPGDLGNLTERPRLAADGYHELLGSPTIGKGATDGDSSPLDIDGEQRVQGLADIGADEFLQLASTTSLACAPPTVRAGTPTACIATVSSAVGDSPTGIVKLASSTTGSFAAGGSCTLAPTAANQAACQLAFTPSAAGAHKLTASYQGSDIHGPSDGSASVSVQGPGAKAPNTRLKRKPARKTSSPKASFTFASDEAGSSFQCKLDKKRFRACRSPFKAKGLKPGRHSFQVRAVSSADTADPTPAKYSWRVSR